MAPLVKPVLVTMVWRGGDRFTRCLASIAESRRHFSRIVISITSDPTSSDMAAATAFAEQHPGVEVICTGRELPTMQHQTFWVDYLEKTGTNQRDWIYWLAYDDQVRGRGIDALVDIQGSWPLRSDTAYFGPWAMRHEKAEVPFQGPWDVPLESWTSFPAPGPTRLRVLDWIRLQLVQPTYMQMSGSVCQFGSYLALRDLKPYKTGPMRIEMATAAAPPNLFVEEFPDPIAIIYGRSNSDRASYGKAARREDLHLLGWITRRLLRHGSDIGRAAHIGANEIATYTRAFVTGQGLPKEEWRVRNWVDP